VLAATLAEPPSRSPWSTRQTRRFAGALGHLAKSHAIDAADIAHFAEDSARLEPTGATSDPEQVINA